MSQLRRVLEPDRERRAPATVLVTVAPGYAFFMRASYHARDDLFAEIVGSGFTSPIDGTGSDEVRKREADQAQAWFKRITVETFG